MSEPSDFSWMADRKLSEEVYRAWSDLAWREQYSADPEQCGSNAYEVGFKDGFTDYVFAGGSGEPPPVPPRLFWNVDVRNPRGRSEATDWFAGFRHGAQVAREEGHRKRALIPSSLFLFGPREENWKKEPSYLEPALEPIMEPIPEPLQPEFVLPGRVQPEANPEVTEPELPIPTAPTAEMPSVEVPAIAAPEVEKLPQPQAVPEREDSLPQPDPIENPTEDVRPPSEFDDIFGAPDDVDAYEPQARQTNSQRVIRQDLSVQQAKAAFTAALRRRAATSGNSYSDRRSKPRRRDKTRHHKRAETLSKTAAIPVRRPAAIPKSEDKAKEMFRRLSH